MIRCLCFILLLAMAACRSDESASAYGPSDKIWRLVALNNNSFTAKATLTFPETGRIAGAAPCNSYSSKISGTYPLFDAGPILATKRACPDLAAESAFFVVLESVTDAEVSGNTMILSNTDGLTMVFSAAD